MHSATAYLYLLAFPILLVGLAPWVGRWIAGVLEGKPPRWLSWLRPLELAVYRLAGVDCQESQSALGYAKALLTFNALGFVALLSLQRVQGVLPLNPEGMAAVPWGVAVNTAVSFVTNTNWQAYSGEASLSYLTQMLGLGVQNFLSAATGLAVLAVLARGLGPRSHEGLGNFWTDLTRSTLYLLFPLSLLLGGMLLSQGVVMSFQAYPEATTLSGEVQRIPLGPAASQVAIKQLGTNGGGFFGLNSAHPLENPTPASNFLQTLALLLLPAAGVLAFGEITRARHHAWWVLGLMVAFLIATVGLSLWAETQAHPQLGSVAAWEGKETRLGIVPSVLWAQATTLASNGSVNAMHGSLSPISGGLALLNMLLGEVVFGGVGSGMYGMVAMIVLTVFLSGLLVGRTPEYLGKKISVHEVRMAAVAVLLPCAVVLGGCMLSLGTEAGRAAVGTAGPHALTEVLYAWASLANNNGSAFGSLTATGDLYTWGGAVAMLLGRFGVMLPVIALAGAFARKPTVPPSAGTLPTHGLTFVTLLAVTLLLVGGLNFFPAIVLGPMLEHWVVGLNLAF